MPLASDESFIRLRYWPTIGCQALASPCGRRIKRSSCHGVKPCDSAASRCPWLTARSPEAISSTRKAEVKTPSPHIEQRNSGVSHQTLPGRMDQACSSFTTSFTASGSRFQAAKYQNSSWTSSGVLRNNETHAATSPRPARPPPRRRASSRTASRVASRIPATLTQTVVRKPEIIHCNGCPLRTPCQSSIGVTRGSPGAADPAPSAENAARGHAADGRKTQPAGRLRGCRRRR